MSNERKVGRRAHRDRMDFDQNPEVRDWCQSNGVTKEELREAVRQMQNFLATLELFVDKPREAHRRAGEGSGASAMRPIVGMQRRAKSSSPRTSHPK